MGRTGRGGPFDRALVTLVLGVILMWAGAFPVMAQESPAPATPAPAASTPPVATPAPAPVATPAPAATQAPAQSPDPTDRRPRAGPRWDRAVPAEAGRGFELHDVIAGGPGFIAVGGGQRPRDDAAPRALIWLSEDGQSWQPAPLFGEAGVGIVESITATPDGFVAVGHECCPDRAVVWRSADGIVWERVPDAEPFAGAAMFDVVSGASGLTAVGCQSNRECSSGRVWRSADGSTWEVAADVTMIPFSVTETADGFVAAGTDSDIGGRAATATSPDGVTWTVSVGNRRPGTLDDLAVYGDQVLAAGSEAVGQRERDLGVLLAGPPPAWQPVESRRFRGAHFATLAATADRILLAGFVTEAQVTVPFSLWSSDLGTFLRGRFPRANEADGARVNGAAFSSDGTLAVAVGVLVDGGPAVWVSELEATS